MRTGDAFRIEGDSEATQGAVLKCTPVSLSLEGGYKLEFQDYGCLVEANGLNRPQMRLTLVKPGIPAGKFEFLIRTRNPSKFYDTRLSGVFWRVSTWRFSGNRRLLNPEEAALPTAGDNIGGGMLEAAYRQELVREEAGGGGSSTRRTSSDGSSTSEDGVVEDREDRSTPDEVPLRHLSLLRRFVLERSGMLQHISKVSEQQWNEAFESFLSSESGVDEFHRHVKAFEEAHPVVVVVPEEAGGEKQEGGGNTQRRQLEEKSEGAEELAEGSPYPLLLGAPAKDEIAGAAGPPATEDSEIAGAAGPPATEDSEKGGKEPSSSSEKTQQSPPEDAGSSMIAYAAEEDVVPANSAGTTSAKNLPPTGAHENTAPASGQDSSADLMHDMDSGDVLHGEDLALASRSQFLQQNPTAPVMQFLEREKRRRTQSARIIDSGLTVALSPHPSVWTLPRMTTFFPIQTSDVSSEYLTFLGRDDRPEKNSKIW